MDWLRLLYHQDAGAGGAGAPSVGADGTAGGVPTESQPEGDAGDGGDAEPIVPDGEGDEGAEGAGDGKGEGTGEGEGEGEGVATPEDGRVIPPYIRKMKETDPASYKEAKAQFFDLRSRRAVHSTVQAAQADRDTIESLGGSEGIGKIQGEITDFHTLSSQFTKGDPAFVKDLFEQDPIAASLHVQPMLDAMKAADVEGYKGLLARTWQGEFTQVGLPNALKALGAAVEAGDKAKAVELLGAITNWQQTITDFASRAEDPRVRTLLAERTKQAEGKEKADKDTFIKSYETEAVNTVVADAAKVFDSFFRNRKLSKDDRDDLLRECFRAADGSIASDKAFHEQKNAHLSRGDSKAALKLVKARYASAFPEAVKKVLRRYGMLSGKPGAKQPVIQNQGGAGGGKGPVSVAGFTKVNVRPRAEEIDRRKTTDSDIINKRATLKDGKKISWAHLGAKPAA